MEAFAELGDFKRVLDKELRTYLENEINKAKAIHRWPKSW